MAAMRTVLLGMMVSLSLAGPVAAADVTEPAPIEAGGWKYQLTLYGWATSLTGDIGVRDLPVVHADVSFADILRHLHGAFMGSIYGTNGEWMFLGDLIWAKTAFEASGPIVGTVNLVQTQAIASGIIGYALPVNIPNLDLSATAGIRYNYLKADLDIAPADFPGISREGKRDWVDPTVGLFAHYDFNDRWFANGLADIGGFGAGSKISAQAFAAVGYNWNEKISTALGYRVLYTDYDKDNFLYKTTEYGPYLSLGIHF
ncbi:hypothetical protein C7I85_27450 [Mesorhizobium soli]|uniref:Outer membrane protein beta-barrel domain-containing protein n=2 Tax=Pseudaminobacter soli (ex Li et al. 2025) TaxID=1295366 RepID=A0A2P7RVY3_9HYPH|nr:hypothetical protein C7I85_27450 [Mesorhizobium soli]